MGLIKFGKFINNEIWQQRWWEVYISQIKEGLSEKDATSIACNKVEHAMQEMYQFFNKKMGT